MLLIFGGLTSVLRPVLTEERIPDGWEPAIRARYGLTILNFNLTALKVEHNIDVKAATAELEREREEGTSKASA